MSILHDTVNELRKHLDYQNLAIVDFYIGKPFTVIKLNNNAVGATMNYYHQGYNLDAVMKYSKVLLYFLKKDPLLINILFEEPIDLPEMLLYTLQNTLVNALSNKLIKNYEIGYPIIKKDNDILFKSLNVNDDIQDIQYSVIGYGGYFYTLLKRKVQKIYVADKQYGTSCFELRLRELEQFRKKYPDTEIHISNGDDLEKQIEKSKVVFVTGSAFSNGTMEELLETCSGVDSVVIQGESCSIYPKILFEKYSNIRWIETTIKPENTLELMNKDFNFFRKEFFETYLDYICILNKKERGKME